MNVYYNMCDFYAQKETMKKIEWKQDNEYCWSLFDNGRFVGTVSYNAVGVEHFGKYGGSFYTSDGGMISLNPIGNTVMEAKARIQDNYLQDRSYQWWMA